MSMLSVLSDAPVQATSRPDPAAGPAAPWVDPAVLPLERVEAELCTLAGQIAAATSRFLVLLADFDAREGWAGWGVRSCAHWLSWRCGLGLRTAHEHVRVARALRELPRSREVFGQGRISYSKVRAITRVATPDTEADLADAALASPTGQLERLLRGLRAAQASDNHDTDPAAATAAIAAMAAAAATKVGPAGPWGCGGAGTRARW